MFYYTKWCPLALYDADDWIYIARERIPLPLWRDWNPTKVLPETLVPLIGRISAILVYPITRDYVTAVTWGSAVLMSVLIAVLCYLVYRFMYRRIGVAVPTAIVAEVILLAGCYWIFRNRGGSRYLFYASSLNTTYNYTIPGIVNAITVLMMMQYERFITAYRKFKVPVRILYWLLVYCSIFSNLFHSGILAVYCGTILLISIIRYIVNRDTNSGGLRKWIVDNRIEIIILCMWLVAVVFEMSGGRASAVGTGEGFSLHVSIQQLIVMVRAFNKIFLAALLLSMLITIYQVSKFAQHNGYSNIVVAEIPVLLVLNLVIFTVYQLLLNAQIHYMSRIEASWGIWFYCILLVTVTIVRMMSQRHIGVLVAIAAMVILLAIYPDGRYALSNINDVSYEACVATDHLAIDAIMQAVADNESEVTIHIPDYSDTASAWGLNEGYGQLISEALYHNGIIDQQVTVITVLDKDMNEIIEAN